MKANVSQEMKSRLLNAAANGSVIAKDVLAELKKECDISDIIRGSYNFFSTKRKRTSCSSFQKIRIVFTACNKDLAHENFPDKGNPNAPWFPENRADLEPSTFIGLFKNLPQYDPDDIKYFCSAISLDSKVSIKICSSMNDFIEAYSEENYILSADTDESTLHHSCMRYADMARNAADFYHNFAGAKIMVAKDNHGYIVGRAIIWDNLKWEDDHGGHTQVSLIDRIYSSHSFVLELMKCAAQTSGIIFRKRYNDYSHLKECVVMTPVKDYDTETCVTVSLSLEVPVCQWHKKGVPYMDTFRYISLKEDKLELRNNYVPDIIADCQSTNGYAQRNAMVCPLCNRVHSDSNSVFCSQCQSSVFTESAFGRLLNGPAIKYNGTYYPRTLFKKGKPISQFKRYLQIEKLYSSYE